jgi:hypothetical protein
VELGTARDIYAQSLYGDDARDCLERIALAAREQRVAVMCFEADEVRCTGSWSSKRYTNGSATRSRRSALGVDDARDDEAPRIRLLVGVVSS